MSKTIGRLRSVGLAKEAVKGTAVVPTYCLPFTSFNPNPVINNKTKDGATGRIEAGHENDIVSKMAQPSLEGILTDKAVGLILLATLGQVSSVAKASPNTDVYDHTFSVKNDNDHPSLCASYKDANMAKQISYAMLSKLEIEAKLSEYVSYKADFISKLEANGSTTPAFVSENAFVPRHISVKVADDVAGLETASAVDIQSVKISVNKNAEANFSLGSDEPSSIVNKELAITGDIECLENDETWKSLFINGTNKAMRITMLSDAVIGSNSHPELTITFNKVFFDSWKESASLKDLTKENMSFTMLYSLDDSKAIEAVLTNLATAY